MKKLVTLFAFLFTILSAFQLISCEDSQEESHHQSGTYTGMVNGMGTPFSFTVSESEAISVNFTANYFNGGSHTTSSFSETGSWKISYDESQTADAFELANTLLDGTKFRLKVFLDNAGNASGTLVFVDLNNSFPVFALIKE